MVTSQGYPQRGRVSLLVYKNGKDLGGERKGLKEAVGRWFSKFEQTKEERNEKNWVIKLPVASVGWKIKNYNLKLENVLFGQLAKDFSPGNGFSDGSDGLLLKTSGRSQDIQEFLQQKPGHWNTKRLLLIKEIQTSSQGGEFSALLCTGRGKSLGPLHSFLRGAS